MRLLDRYLLRELLIPLFFCLSGFLIFVIAFSLFAELNRYQENKLGVQDVLELYAARIPGDLALIMPIALLLALLYALTNHARHNELTAMRAAGVSLGRLCLPYFAVGLCLSGLVFYLNEKWVPQAAEREERIMTRHQARPVGALSEDVKEGLIFKNTRDGRDWHFDRYNLKTYSGLKPAVRWIAPGGARRVLVADRMERTNEVWTFYSNVRVYETAAKPGAVQEPVLVTNVLAMPEFTETPEQIRREVRYTSFFKNLASPPPDVPIADILDYLDLHPKLPEVEDRRLRTDLQGRLAAPWTCLVVVLVAIPFGAASGRRNLFVGVASSIVIVFTYFVMMKVGTGLGTAGILPPVVAAWLPNICFSAVGITMMQRVR
jgi:lipopolysaccharide export system permease protein